MVDLKGAAIAQGRASLCSLLGVEAVLLPARRMSLVAGRQSSRGGSRGASCGPSVVARPPRGLPAELTHDGGTARTVVGRHLAKQPTEGPPVPLKTTSAYEVRRIEQAVERGLAFVPRHRRPCLGSLILRDDLHVAVGATVQEDALDR